jgi:hypothetical protein
MYASAFPTGTLMVFQQTTAPPGWTKQTTHNDKAMRVVTGTASSGGATAFTSVFNAAGGSTTLTTGHLPASGLSIPSLSVTATGSGDVAANTGTGGAVTAVVATTLAIAGPTEITVSGAATGISVSGSTGTGTTGNMGTGNGHTHVTPDISYVDVIIAAKS